MTEMKKKVFIVRSWDGWEDAALHRSQLPVDLHEAEAEAPCHHCRFYDSRLLTCVLEEDEDAERWLDLAHKDCPAKTMEKGE